MFLKHHFASRLPINSLRTCARLTSTTLTTMPDAAIIAKLSKGLPAALGASKQQQMGARLWKVLNDKERKEIRDAFSCGQMVQKLPQGSPVNFISNISPTLECWVDASTVPACIAVIVDKSFVTFNLVDGWDNIKERNNHWAECVGLELVAHVIVALGYSNVHARVRSDSCWALGMFSAAPRPGQQATNESVNRLRALLTAYSIKMDFIQVTSKQNIADAFTRGRYNPDYRRADCTVSLPKALGPLMQVTT